VNSRAATANERDPESVARGRRLRQCRLAKGFGQKDVAKVLGVTEKSVSNHEIGLHSPTQYLDGYAELYGITTGWIWDGDERDDRIVSQLGDTIIGQFCDVIRDQLGVLSEGITSQLGELIRVQRDVCDQLRLLRDDLERRAQSGV
jgi:transcriptional regulator with XRE-family HTH domain